MTKKEKVLNVCIMIYFILLLALMLMMFISIFTQVSGWIIFVYAFVVVFIIGYLVIVLLRINTYNYECPKCMEARKMIFGEALFSRRGDNTRYLKCKKCGEKQIMKRVPR